MPVMDGLQATRQILSAWASPERPRVLMLTTFDLDDYVYAHPAIPGPAGPSQPNLTPSRDRRRSFGPFVTTPR